jgi:3',5'-cyclic AMP phosphodiesterase CpdA
MAFFHIPLPEYRNLDQPRVGDQREGVTAPRYNSGARKLFGQMNVKVVSVGHDHCNEYCLRDLVPGGNEETDNIWLCYGGGSGEGGYGGYGGYTRKLRLYEVDINEGRISTWKRKEDSPDAPFDYQDLVKDGVVI